MNIFLPKPLAAWIEAQVRSGRYADAGDYVRELIRQDQQRTAAKLQAMIMEADEGAETAPMDLEGFLADMHAQKTGKKA